MNLSTNGGNTQWDLPVYSLTNVCVCVGERHWLEISKRSDDYGCSGSVFEEQMYSTHAAAQPNELFFFGDYKPHTCKTTLAAMHAPTLHF